MCGVRGVWRGVWCVICVMLYCMWVVQAVHVVWTLCVCVCVCRVWAVCASVVYRVCCLVLLYGVYCVGSGVVLCCSV